MGIWWNNGAKTLIISISVACRTSLRLQKNITYPTDAKLHKKIVRKVLSIMKQLELPLRQSYTFVLKAIYRDQRFRNHPKDKKPSGRQTFTYNSLETGQGAKA